MLLAHVALRKGLALVMHCDRSGLKVRLYYTQVKVASTCSEHMHWFLV